MKIHFYPEQERTSYRKGHQVASHQRLAYKVTEQTNREKESEDVICGPFRKEATCECQLKGSFIDLICVWIAISCRSLC